MAVHHHLQDILDVGSHSGGGESAAGGAAAGGSLLQKSERELELAKLRRAQRRAQVGASSSMFRKAADRRTFEDAQRSLLDVSTYGMSGGYGSDGSSADGGSPSRASRMRRSAASDLAVGTSGRATMELAHDGSAPKGRLTNAFEIVADSSGAYGSYASAHNAHVKAMDESAMHDAMPHGRRSALIVGQEEEQQRDKPSGSAVAGTAPRRGSVLGASAFGGGGSGGGGGGGGGARGRRASIRSTALPAAAADHGGRGEETGGGWASGMLADAGAYFGDLAQGAADVFRSTEVAVVWSTELRGCAKALQLRSVSEARRLLLELREKARRHAQGLQRPTPLLGVEADARTLVALTHEWHAGRPERLLRLHNLLLDDPRRRFVLGREKYAQEVKEATLLAIDEIVQLEISHEAPAVTAITAVPAVTVVTVATAA